MSIPAWAVRGAKVVCVDAKPLPGYEEYPFLWPSERVIYTVRSTFWNERRGHWQLRLAELVNPVLPWLDGNYEPAFGVHRLRPVVPRKTEEQDVAEFRKLLTQKLPEAV